MTLGTSDQVKAAPHDTTRDGGGHAQAEKDGPGLQVQAGRGHHSGTQPPEDEDADGAGWGVLGGCCCSPPSTPSHMVMGVRSRWTQLPGRNGPPAALGWRGSAAQALAGARPACAPQTNCWMVKTSTFRAASCSLPLHPALQSPQPTVQAGATEGIQTLQHSGWGQRPAFGGNPGSFGSWRHRSVPQFPLVTGAH